ncbi:MmcQ/YjbR family DNA-binding protein [Rhodococcus marinonascens]|uniref:MmcQ/YjbR family DNA-binding protein n=1 Tax=Rhodococcus marinonascens TaxID=38311 RepID=UPI000935475F|nr:MmcQ/YjbR family DNA-binding protein [Rhodococcus marinonascens]
MQTWTDVVEIGLSLPDVEESTAYRTPALKVAGKLLARLRVESDGALAVMCGFDEKAALLAEGDPYYTTPHYDGYGSILIDLEKVDVTELTELLRRAWRVTAPPDLRKRFDQL